MKTLDFEKMEAIEGGRAMAYCEQLAFWLNGGAGYQGDYKWLGQVFVTYCYY